MKTKAFSLIELMTVVVIIAILATIAIPLYRDQVVKGKQAEGARVLATVKAKQEVFRSTNFRYTNDLSDLGGFPADDGTGVPIGEYYYVEVTAADANTFKARVWDGQKAISNKGTGADEWVITETLDQPCHSADPLGQNETCP